MQPVSSDAPCISRRIIGKNTQDAVRHGQARVRAAFPHTLPILAGFLFLGFAYGLLMRTKGFSFLYPMCMAMTIFGGSLEYVTVSMLLSAFAPLETFLMALLIQARHLFYGLSLLGKYAGLAGRSRCSSLACATKPSPSPAPLMCRRRLTAAGSTCG